MTALFGNRATGVSQGTGLTGDQPKHPLDAKQDGNDSGNNPNGTSDGAAGGGVAETRETAQEHNDQGGKDARLDAKLDPAGTPHHHQPTAEEAGIDLDAASKVGLIADSHNISKTPLADNVGALYSSHPTQNFTVGPFHFVKGVLKFTGDEKEGLRESDFEKVLGDLPAVDRAGIRKVSISAAEDIVAQHRSQFGGANSIDSAAGRDALERLHRAAPLVGTQPIGHAALPMEDNNKPITVEEPTATEAESTQG